MRHDNPFFTLFSLTLVAALTGWASHRAIAAPPSVADALSLVPVQKEIAFDRPTASETNSCTIKSEKLDGRAGWVVRGPAGQLLRCFADTNGDNKVDQWCYYHNGIESYRDLDTDFNGKADQYRWLGLSGLRWGLDANEDGRIDAWKMISAEEVTAEIIAALRERDPQRFAAVVLSPAELRELGLGAERSAKIRSSIDTAVRRFEQLARTQRKIGRETHWMHFGATRPGIMPAGTDGSTRDVAAYENVIAMLESGGKHDQLAIGTLVKVGDSWRAVDVPVGLLDEQASLAASSYLLQASNLPEPDLPNAAANPRSELAQRLAEQLEKAEAALAKASPGRAKEAAYENLTDIQQKLANNAAEPAERVSWIQQLADTLGTAAQTGEYPKAIQRLDTLHRQLAKAAPRDCLTGYVRFRLMNANYAADLNVEEPDFAEIQEKWLEQLTSFVEDFPNCPDATEARFDLAIGEEFAGNEEEAIAWYKKIIDARDTGVVGKKAAGAVFRLTSVGKPLVLRGRTVEGKNFSTAALKGRLVLVHYWATYSAASTADIQRLAQLYKQYGPRGFAPVGISVDSDTNKLSEFLRKSRVPWPVLYENGGLDSPLAVELGVLTVPTMILVDEGGKVVNRNLQINELEAILKKKLGDAQAKATRR